ncbi:MAG: polymerase subunit epsilon [Pseudomonadota bacterium]
MRAFIKSWVQSLGWHSALTPEQKHRLESWRKLPRPALSDPLLASRCVVVDVETSGLNLIEDRLISIGAVAMVNGRIDLGDSFSVVLQQKTVSERSNILLHGIGGTAQREGQPPADALLSFLEYLGHSPLVAFHVTFDETMIRRALRDFLGFNFKHPWLDLAYLMPALNVALASKNRSLDDWVNTFNIRIDSRHDALADALATAQLLQVAQRQAVQRKGLTFASLRDLEKAQRWVSGVG